MPLWFRHVVTWISYLKSIEAELILVEIRLKRAQRDGPETVRILGHLGARCPGAWTSFLVPITTSTELAFGARSRNVTRPSGRSWVKVSPNVGAGFVSDVRAGVVVCDGVGV